MGEELGNWSASPIGVKNAVRGTVKSEMGYQHAKLGKKNPARVQLNLREGIGTCH